MPKRDPKTGLIFAHDVARELARRGELVAATFDLFQRAVFPGAPNDQVNALRIAFFAGAQEIFAMMLAAMDPGEDPTPGDMEFMEQWTSEIEQFHEKTIAAMKAEGGRQ